MQQFAGALEGSRPGEHVAYAGQRGGGGDGGRQGALRRLDRLRATVGLCRIKRGQPQPARRGVGALAGAREQAGEGRDLLFAAPQEGAHVGAKQVRVGELGVERERSVGVAECRARIAQGVPAQSSGREPGGCAGLLLTGSQPLEHVCALRLATGLVEQGSQRRERLGVL